VPASHASSPDAIRGGCAFWATNVVGDSHAGLMYESSVTTTGDPVPQPIGATVTCWITVNGIEAAGTRHTYGDVTDARGVQAGTDPVSFTARPGDFVDECQLVVFADNTTTGPDCPADVGVGFPPQALLDLVNAVENPVLDAACGDDRSQTICPIVCSYIRQFAGRYGPLLITTDGDVDVVNPWRDPVLIPVYDCPSA